MRSETKAEIVVAGGAAAFLAYLWWANRAAGAGTGVETLTQPSNTPFAAPGVPDPTFPGEVANSQAAPFGITFNAGDISLGGSTINGPQVGGVTGGAVNVGAPSFYNATPYGAAGSCGCGCDEHGTPIQFGSVSDAASWLAQSGGGSFDVNAPYY